MLDGRSALLVSSGLANDKGSSDGDNGPFLPGPGTHLRLGSITPHIRIDTTAGPAEPGESPRASLLRLGAQSPFGSNPFAADCGQRLTRLVCTPPPVAVPG